MLDSSAPWTSAADAGSLSLNNHSWDTYWLPNSRKIKERGINADGQPAECQKTHWRMNVFSFFSILFCYLIDQTWRQKKKIPIMIHHLSLSFSRPLCMIAALRLSLAFALGRPVFARLVTSKSAPPPVFPVDPLFLYLYSLSLISIVQSISPPFLLLFSPCFPQSLTTLSVSCSLPASLCFFFLPFPDPHLSVSESHQSRDIKGTSPPLLLSRADRFHAKARYPQGRMQNSVETHCTISKRECVKKIKTHIRI